ncbi:hypothetical protein GCM10010385_21190 [Streptomyces geysiriensis]|nr:hypothetical protein GCM10010385_21190 [Streptomyces geysiriensis]GHC44732.1 hypothetical protein GCM10010308_75030 [Streptomyces vinaceusdrappus]
MSVRDVPARSASDMRPLMQPALTEPSLSLTRQVLDAQGASRGGAARGRAAVGRRGGLTSCHTRLRGLYLGTMSGAPSRAASAVRSSGWRCDSRSASTRFS